MKYLFLIVCICFVQVGWSQPELSRRFLKPGDEAKPWVFWYWMHGAVSKEGITKDLEAMQSVGLGGAYLMPIRDTSSKIPFQPTARQLTKEWWLLVDHAMKEAHRLHLQIAMHLSDGFALAGGPWILPEMSMQKLVWTKTAVEGGRALSLQLEQPQTNEGYYKDISVYAYPIAQLPSTEIPSVVADNGLPAQFLATRTAKKETFKAEGVCKITYTYPQPITLRSIQVHTSGNNYPAYRLWVRFSEDGVHFKTITRLEAPRHGWQDNDEEVSFAIPETKARFFQFEYNKEGTEPGSEELDAAKWKPNLKIMGLYLSEEPVIHQFESKNGSVWRVSKRSSDSLYGPHQIVKLNEVINLTAFLKKDGSLQWQAPKGFWRIVRIGHTSTGHTNYTGGAALGLECNKFEPAIVKFQLNQWLGQVYQQVDSTIAKKVLTMMHIDSWECGSQNWTSTFPQAFRKQHGYDLKAYLLTMVGVPVTSMRQSEKVLYDARSTMASLVQNAFFGTIQPWAQQHHWKISAEAIAPTMISNGMQHFGKVDIPMGEFWWNSPTHDKPNDMLDAVSGAHIYGKKIIQAEAFTTVRMDWSEHPGMLKSLGDRNLAIGANRLVFHVFTQNPWLDKKPGMTLDGVGLYYQRDQTWFQQSKAWVNYLTRSQSLLQYGKPVADIAVFGGEEYPSRSLLPNKLTKILPGLIGRERVQRENARLANIGQPMANQPEGVSHSANIYKATDWIDPLQGYAYDCLTPEVLLSAVVRNRQLYLPSGATYKILVIPYHHSLLSASGLMTISVAQKILSFLQLGLPVILDPKYTDLPGSLGNDKLLLQIMQQIKRAPSFIQAPFAGNDLQPWGIAKDIAYEHSTSPIAWTHRTGKDGDIYFISNPENREQHITLTLPYSNRQPELWDPLTLQMKRVPIQSRSSKNIVVDITLAAQGSCFVVLPMKSITATATTSHLQSFYNIPVDRGWKLQFDASVGGPTAIQDVDSLILWNEQAQPAIRYYSGSVVCRNTFNLPEGTNREVELALTGLHDIATVRINGEEVGIIWTAPYTLDISKYCLSGTNTIELVVTNTWANRLIGDQLLPEAQRITYTTAPFRLAQKPLLKAGLEGVEVIVKHIEWIGQEIRK